MIDPASHFPTLRRLKGPLGAAWRWWTGELAALLPSPARRSGGPAVLPVDAEGNPAAGPAAGAVELRLPAVAALRTTLLLPAAAEENLRQVIAFEMDRETPFKAAEVRFDARIARRDGHQIAVELLIVPRSLAERSLARASGLGLTVERLSVEGDQDGAFDLRLPEERPAVRRPSRLLLGLTAGLAMAGLAAPPLLNEWRAAELDALLEPVQERAGVALRLRDELDRRNGASSALDLRKRRETPVVALLDELTRRLPDEVWLDQFRVAGGELRVTGYAPSSAELIALLEASPMIEQVRFETGVTQDPLRRRERFQIAARLEEPAP